MSPEKHAPLLASVDVETTGLDPTLGAEVYEIGLVRRTDDGSPDQEYRWWLPIHLNRADPNALRIGRYFQRHPNQHNLGLSRVWFPQRGTGEVETGDGIHEPIPEICRMLMRLTADAHLVGINVSFDTGFLTRLLRANGCCPAWQYRLIPVEGMAAGYLAGRYWSLRDDLKLDGKPTQGMRLPEVATLPWRSDDLARAVGVDPARFERHSALGDARLALAIFDQVMTGGAP